MATKKSKKKKKVSVQMRISQGGVAKTAIRNIELSYRKMGLNPKSVKSERQRMLGTASAPTKLIEEVAAASDQHGGLIGMPFDSNKAREALAFAAAFEPVATKAEAFAQRVRDAIVIAKGDTGSAALAAYAAMKGVVRRPEGAPLRDSFDKMTQIMKERRKHPAQMTARRAAAKAKAAKAKEAAATPPVASAPAATTPSPSPVTPPAADKQPGSTTVVVTPPSATA